MPLSSADLDNQPGTLAALIPWLLRREPVVAPLFAVLYRHKMPRNFYRLERVLRHTQKHDLKALGDVSFAFQQDREPVRGYGYAVPGPSRFSVVVSNRNASVKFVTDSDKNPRVWLSEFRC